MTGLTQRSTLVVRVIDPRGQLVLATVSGQNFRNVMIAAETCIRDEAAKNRDILTAVAGDDAAEKNAAMEYLVGLITEIAGDTPSDHVRRAIMLRARLPEDADDKPIQDPSAWLLPLSGGPG